MTETIFDVLIIGAGFAGLCAAIKLKNAGITNIQLVDKADSIGGTWHSNHYPGAACDVPSHFYCYSFEPNPNWSRKFAKQPEILAYINHCADKYDLRPFIQLNSQITALNLEALTGIWVADMANGSQLKARHIINGMGWLHKPNIPDFKGRENFTGPVMHSAQWDHKVDFRNKHVAIIGSAASAIQIIPELQKICAQVDIYQRTPNYIAPRRDRPFTQTEKNCFSRFPWWGRFYRWMLYKRMDVLVYPLTKQKSLFSNRATKAIKTWIHETITDADLADRMTPDYTIGCKRILLSDVFYNIVTKNNVAVISDPIDSLQTRGIQTKTGVLYPCDIVIYATGFDIEGHMRSLPMTGTGGVTLADLGLDGEIAFKGAVHSQFPNHYWVTGANTGVGTTSVIYMIEVQVDYILQLIKAAGNTQLISVKPEKMQAYNDAIQADLSKSVWASGCNSWYLRSDGKIVTLYPGNTKDFRKDHAYLNLDNYNLMPNP